MPQIVVKFEEKVIEPAVTEKKHISIGRTPDNDIVLDNRGVSRKHAQIEFNNNSALIIDNESLNGTFVNNRKISEEVLKDNDTINIGKFRLAKAVTTLGRADFADIRVKGFFLSGLQAKIVKEPDGFYLVNLGKRGKTVLNGEAVSDRHALKNDDLVQVWRSVFRY